MAISSSHSNRRAFNWLIYDIGDEFLSAHAALYRGDLYDLGCGDMPFRSFFLAHCDRYIGVDWGESRHSTAPDIAADLNRPLPIGDDVADTVVSISVLEHVREPASMLAEARRILKPGGHLILHVPFMWHVHEEPHDYYRFTAHGLRHLVGEAGFCEISVEPTTGFWSMWTLKLNYQLRKLVRGPAIVRAVSGAILTVFWWLDQNAARLMDRLWPSEGETAGYVVTARKPAAGANGESS